MSRSRQKGTSAFWKLPDYERTYILQDEGFCLTDLRENFKSLLSHRRKAAKYDVVNAKYNRNVLKRLEAANKLCQEYMAEINKSIAQTGK